MLVNKCYLKDIREYEENSGTNILRLFDEIRLDNLCTLVMIFNKGLTEMETYELLDRYFEYENKSPLDAFIEIKSALLGYDINEPVDNSEADEDECMEDITEYNFLSDFHMKLCMQLMSLGVSYSEFWSLTTKEMYQVFHSIEQKMILEFNRQMNIEHISAGLHGAAVWGKLPKKAPQISTNGMNDEDRVINHPKYGEITVGTLKTIRTLEKLGG